MEKRGGLAGDTGISGKTDAGEQFVVLNLDDAVDYVTHGLKRLTPICY